MSSRILTDAEIIEEIVRQADPDRAIRQLYRTGYETLSRFVIHNNGSDEDAQDVFQEVIVSFIALVRAGKFRGESSIKTFLFSLNRNLWLNELKKRGRSQVREMRYSETRSGEEENISLVIESRESRNMLMQAVASLGEACQKILLLYYFEKRSMREILSELHYGNEQVVRNKKYKCLKKLEEKLASDKNLYEKLKNFIHE